MTKIIYLILALSINVSCNSQIKDSLTNNNNKTMEYFNENKYKDWEKDPKYSSNEKDKFLMKVNERVRIIGDDETIQVEETNINTLYGIVKVYSTKTKQLKSILYEFDGMQINTYKLYDENGNLKKEKNLNKPYSFSIEDLIKKFKEEYNVDIENPKNVFSIHRYEEKEDVNIPLYEVGLRRDVPNIWDFYLINGNTGETLYHMEVKKGDRKHLLQEYLKNKKSSSAIYKTYEGKTYTKEEWAVFEQEQYNEHLLKTGRADLIKPTETSKTDNKKSSFIADEDDVKPKKKGFWDNLLG